MKLSFKCLPKQRLNFSPTIKDIAKKCLQAKANKKSFKIT